MAMRRATVVFGSLRVRVLALALVMATAVGIVGFHSHAHSHGDLTVRDAAGNEVTVGQWKLGNVPQAVPAALAAGDLQFSLANTDEVAHDFMVVRNDGEAGRLPVRDGKVDLGAVGEVVAEVRAFEPGEDGSLSFNFEPGAYVLFCNQRGHYEHGMYYAFEVE